MTAHYGPVDIPGFTLARPLGSGGYADVFLYEQDLPRRLVAVKVMREPVDDPAARARFASEAALMAALSTHPSIVTIHHGAVADDGRPYLVMEYCSRPTLAEAYPARTVSVPELLQTVVRLCGAVATAHRAGILHRGIKPANVLTTDYGWPALSDFGLSSNEGTTADAGGASVPWAAPEQITGRGFDARSDVYALAATAYTVLAGRSPFEDPTAPADPTGLVSRVVAMPAPPIGRDDVPPALERLILASLAKDPGRRTQSAAEFARSLQRIEQDLRLPMTHLDIRDLTPPTAAAGADETDLAEPTQFASRRRRTEPDADVEPDAEPTQFASRRRTEPEPAADAEPTQLASRRRTESGPADADPAAAADPAADADPDADARTVLASRAGRPRTGPVSMPAPADEPTQLSGPRRRDARSGQAPAAGAADREGRVDEPTRLAPRDRHHPDTATAATAPEDAGFVPPVSSRRAHDPSKDAGPAETYGIRHTPAAPIVRSAPTPAAAAPSTPLAPADPPPRARARRGATTAIAIVSTVLVIAACLAGIALLAGL